MPGYDPDKYKEIYDNAEGGTWEEKLNSMRRENYAKNADTIRAQKKAAYDKRKVVLKGDERNGIIADEEGKYYKSGSFYSKADPMADAFGPGIISNPEEIKNFEKECEESGVRLLYRENESINYEPGPTIGTPGQIVINRDASYSAWLHEMQHMRDDRDSGWDGALRVWDQNVHFEREKKAYEIEIQLALDAGRDDIAKLLKENLEIERRRIYGQSR